MSKFDKNSILKLVDRYNNILILILMFIVSGILSPFFLTAENLINIFRATSMIGIVAIGMTLVILTGGIDLSVGSVVGLSGALAAGFWQFYHNTLLIFIIPLLVGALTGWVNGILVSKLRLQAFVVTLATMTIARGAGLVYTGGKPIYVQYPKLFSAIAQSYIFGIPTPAILFVLITILVSLLLYIRPLGRSIYAVGGNEESARLSGINANKVKIIVYTIGGLLAAFAGMMLTARMQSGEPGQAGVGWELDAIAAVVIGGTSMSGGTGTVGGTFVGALIIGILSNMFNLLGVEPQWQQLAKGLVIILAVWLQTVQINNSRPSEMKGGVAI